MQIRNKFTCAWLSEIATTQDQLETVLLNSNPDCDEAKLICDFALHAIAAIVALEQELELYRRHAEHCAV